MNPFAEYNVLSLFSIYTRFRLSLIKNNGDKYDINILLFKK